MMIINKLSKESTLQYTLTLIDDILQENKMRVDLFHAYARKHKENLYQTFLKMLNMQDAFINHQASRIVTKLACWGNELISDKELKDFFMWMKDHLEEKVFNCDPSSFLKSFPNLSLSDNVKESLQRYIVSMLANDVQN